MLRAAAYVRVSTEEQARGFSLDAQQAACQDYTAARGWTLVHVYRDVDTGRRVARPAFAELRRHLPRYDAIICWKSDRISRRTLDALQFIEECSEQGVAFVSTTQAFDTEDSIGQAAFTMAAALAQVESDHTSERVRASVRRQLEQGRLPWRAAYGWSRNEGNAVVNPEEAAVVERIFREYAGGWTQQEIAERLRAEGVKRRGRDWGRNSVGDVLRNPGYIGEPLIGRLERRGRRYVRRPRSEWTRAEGLLPPIIALPLWEAARRRGVRGRRPSESALLRTLLQCRECGSPWHVRTRPRPTAYVCSGHPACSIPQMQEAIAIRLFRDELRELMKPDARASVQTASKDEETKRLEAAEERCARAWTAYVHGGVSIDVAMQEQMRVGELEAAVRLGAHPPLKGKSLKQAVAACREALGLEDIEEANRRLRGIVAGVVIQQAPAALELIFWAT